MKGGVFFALNRSFYTPFDITLTQSIIHTLEHTVLLLIVVNDFEKKKKLNAMNNPVAYYITGTTKHIPVHKAGI